MRLVIGLWLGTEWDRPKGIDYEVWRGGQKVKDSGCLEFGKDISWTHEGELPFVGDVIQSVIKENNITVPFNIPQPFRTVLADVHPMERELPEFTKGKSVWFPVANEISPTDPYCYHADPAMGYVKSVSDEGLIEIDVRQAYRRVEPPNIVDETRKMQPLDGTAHVDAKYCFSTRKECMEYISAESEKEYGKVFLADVDTESVDLTEEDLTGLEETNDLKM